MSRSMKDASNALWRMPVAALATVGPDGLPRLSMVPFALFEFGGKPMVAIHVSDLAAHAEAMDKEPRVSLMAMGDVAEHGALALPRVSLRGVARFLEPGSKQEGAAQEAYLAKHPQAERVVGLGGFHWVAIQAVDARIIAGFGAAKTLDAEQAEQALRDAMEEPASAS